MKTKMTNSIYISRFSAQDIKLWDDSLENFNTFTFQFNRRFLDLKNFEDFDASLIAKDTKGSAIALFPINFDPTRYKLISHSRSSYGGAIFADHLGILERLSIYEKFVRELKVMYPNSNLQIRLPPSHIGGNHTSVDAWILWRLGFKPLSLVIHSAVDLRKSINFQKGRVRNCPRSGLEIFESHTSEDLQELWKLLSKVYMERHQVNPVHSFEELMYIKQSFPEFIRVFVSAYQGKIIGGLVFFNTANSFHLQYMAIDPIGRKFSAGDFLVKKAINVAADEAYEFLNFGHSNENQGLDINESLWSFKSKFGTRDFSAITWTVEL